MKIYHSLKSLSDQLGSTRVGLTIGNFDGLHLGHQGLLKELQQVMSTKGGPCVVISFQPHPLEVLYAKKSIRMFDWKDQEEQFAKMGIQYMLIEEFTPQLAAKSHSEFFEGYLLKHLNIEAIRVGHDFHFGKNRQGSLEYLQQTSLQNQIDFKIYPALKRGSEIISSTWIRKCLQEGDIHLANELLGRSFYLRGPVVEGDKRGRLLNFPTANLQCSVDFSPLHGVYRTRTIIGRREFLSATNVGINKSFENDGRLKVETHILDFDEDIYGQEIQVKFLDYIRPEKKFSSLDELKKQIHLDVEHCRHPQLVGKTQI